MPIIKVLAMYIEQKVDYFTMQFAGGNYEFVPYVQALHEHGNILLIEAIGNEYLEPPLSEANQQIMLFLGWSFLCQKIRLAMEKRFYGIVRPVPVSQTLPLGSVAIPFEIVVPFPKRKIPLL